MTYKTHMTIGFTSALLLSELIQEPLAKVIFITTASFGSLLPDVDTPQSFIRRFIPFPFRMKHRGHTHSLVGLLVFSLMIIPFGVNNATLGLICGYMSHILADSLTIYGVYLFYPQTRYRLRLAKIRTGGILEQCLLVSVFIIAILYIYVKGKVYL